MSLEGEIRVDCRLNCFACGILPTFADMRRENPGEVWKCPDVKSPARKIEAELPVIGELMYKDPTDRSIAACARRLGAADQPRGPAARGH